MPWQQAIEAQFRRQGYLWVTVEVIPPGIREGATVVSADTDPLYRTEAVVDGSQAPVEPQATFERSRWRGDGTMYLPSKIPEQNPSINMWADNKLEHTLQASTSLTCWFDKVYDIPGVYAVWDTETNSWPTNLDIIGWALDGSVIDTYSVTDINSVEGFIQCPFEGCYRVAFVIRGWSKPEWRARITELTFGLVVSLNASRSASATFTNSVDLLAGALPKIHGSVTYNNYDQYFDPLAQSGITQYLVPKQKASVQWGLMVDGGSILRLPKYEYFLTGVSAPSDTPKFQLDLGTRLDFLTQKYVHGEFDGQTRTLYEVAESILSRLPMLPSFDGEQPWELDPILHTLSTIAPVPQQNGNVVLQLIANAAGLPLDVDLETGFVRMATLAPVNSNARSIGQMQSLGDPKIEIVERVLSVSVGVHQYSRATARSVIYEATLELPVGTEQTVEVSYNDNKLALEVQHTITGGSVTGIEVFSRRAVLKIVPSSTSTQVELTGVVYEENTSYIETYRDTSIDKGLDVVVENPFITNTAFLPVVTNALLNIFNRRSLAELQYTGYPELVGGTPILNTSRYGQASGYLLSSTVTYNGGWSGQVSMRLESDP